VFAACVKGTVQPWAESVVMAINQSAISGTQRGSPAVVLLTSDSTLNGTRVPATNDKATKSVESLEPAGADQNGNAENVVSAPLSFSSDNTNRWYNLKCMQNACKASRKCSFRPNQRVHNVLESK